ncbi:kinase-like domain-containing protein [Umbelopsis sp. PMI_123]|nr:kinase-like domain-containing protein [Umbelopsis sp. PMI_123]
MPEVAREDEVKSRRMYTIDEQYRRIRTLGKGNFGKVYLAEHRQTLQQVAIKTVDKRNFKNEDQKIHALNEKGISHDFSIRLHHKNIVEVYEVITDDDFIYIIMEYLEGGELFDKIKERGRLDENLARTWFREIVEAVKYIHDNGIVHRDLKPENVLLDKDQHIRICDFGFGKVCDDQHLLTTYCGSPFYAAPEMVTATPYTGSKVDIWSCGVILFAMLSGKLPFQCENMPDLFKKISVGAYNVPHSIKSSPAALIARMLCVKAADRASAQDILDHAWLSGNYADPQSSSALTTFSSPRPIPGAEQNEPLSTNYKSHVNMLEPEIINPIVTRPPKAHSKEQKKNADKNMVVEESDNRKQLDKGSELEPQSKSKSDSKPKNTGLFGGKKFKVAPLKANNHIAGAAAKKANEMDAKLLDRLRSLFRVPKKRVTAV